MKGQVTMKVKTGRSWQYVDLVDLVDNGIESVLFAQKDAEMVCEFMLEDGEKFYICSKPEWIDHFQGRMFQAFDIQDGIEHLQEHHPEFLEWRIPSLCRDAVEVFKDFGAAITQVGCVTDSRSEKKGPYTVV